MVTYVFSDTNRQTSYIADTELNLRGTWAAGTTYSPPIDAVNFGGALWIAVANTTNVSPTTITRVRQWSQLVTYKGIVSPTDLASAIALAESAYEIAVSGTEAIDAAKAAALHAEADAAAALSASAQAYIIAVAGTNIANNAQTVANQSEAVSASASLLASSVTAGVQQLYPIAISGTAGVEQLYPIATAGTAGVNQLYPIATSGTAGVEQVYPIAVAGTNLAILALTWIGTHQAAPVVDDIARATAWSGTAGAAQNLALFTQGTAAGTVYTNIAVLAEAGSRITTDADLQAQINSLSGGNGLAYTALTTAWNGTAGATQAYGLAVAGTDAAATALGIAEEALNLATIGTNTTIALYNSLGLLGVRVDDATTVAKTGTDTANAALFQAHAAYTLATFGTAGVEQVYPIAVAGTNLAQLAYNLATSGTDASAALGRANQAYDLAATGTALALNALGLAQFGTAFTASQVGAESVFRANADQAEGLSRFVSDQNLQVQIGTVTDSAYQALVMAWNGTAGVGQVYAVATSGTAGVNQVYAVATSGTAGVNQLYPIATAGTAGVNQLYTIATSGTAGVNQVYPIAVAGTTIGLNALTAAWAGTATANAALPLTGGTLSGNLRTPQLFVGSGTIPYSSAVSGTIYYDFLGPAYQETTVSGGLVVSAKNLTNVSEICAVLVSDGVQRQVLYDGNFGWFGTQIPYTSATINKKIMVALSCVGTVASKVYGASQPQT